MLVEDAGRELVSGGALSVSKYELDAESAVHIMRILRDTLYTDKILAVLREYSANAWDAHIEVGKGDVPIEVHMPTWDNPTLAIRDFGPGLSPEDVDTVYTKYGKSTKRDRPLVVGWMGVGAKAGYAYTDSFTITSWWGGVKSIYVSALDSSDEGVCTCISREPCSAEETGLEVRIAVASKDFNLFSRKATHLFQFFTPRPTINLDLPPLPEVVTPYGYFDTKREDAGWVAVMGCIPYEVSVEDLDLPYELKHIMNSAGGVVYLPLGAAHIAASREELKYSDTTKTAVRTAFEALVDAYLTEVASVHASASPWQKRILAKDLWRIYKRTPPGWPSHKPIQIETKLFFGLKDEFHPHSANVVYLDDTPTRRNYRIQDVEVVARPTSEVDVTTARSQLDALLAEYDLTGVPVKLVSVAKLEVVHSSRREPAVRDAVTAEKYRKNCFVLKNPSAHPASNRWESCGEPQETDLFVTIDRFVPVIPATAYKAASPARDKKLEHVLTWVKQLLQLPEINQVVNGGRTGIRLIGYKDKWRGERVGIPWMEWLNNFYTQVPLILPMAYCRAIHEFSASSSLNATWFKRTLEWVAPYLPVGHDICQLLAYGARYADQSVLVTVLSRLGMLDAPQGLGDQGVELADGFSLTPIDRLEARYPLLGRFRHWPLWEPPTKVEPGSYYYQLRVESFIKALDYVNAMDYARQAGGVVTTRKLESLEDLELLQVSKNSWRENPALHVDLPEILHRLNTSKVPDEDED